MEFLSSIRVALVCQSNINRSMEAHYQLKLHNIEAHSFGVGSKVKIPGERADSPNVYEFAKTRYQYILDDLMRQNEAHYRQKGMIDMVERNVSVKERPERWQSTSAMFDIVITFEKRVYEVVVADIRKRHMVRTQPVHVINVETKDTHAGASIAGQQVLALTQAVYKSPIWEDALPSLLDEFADRENLEVLYTVMFY